MPQLRHGPKDRGTKLPQLDLTREIDVTKANLKLAPEIAEVTLRYRCSHCGVLSNQEIIPLSRPDVFERLGILSEVESKVPGWNPRE